MFNLTSKKFISMRKTVLTTVLCVFTQFFIFGASDSLAGSNDSIKKKIDKPFLETNNTQVYNGNTMLSKSEVLSILGTYPDLASQYRTGKDLRSTGSLLVAGGIVSMIGGTVLAVNGLLKTANTIYSDYEYYNDPALPFDNDYFLGLGISVIGELMIDGGIACNIIGRIKINRSINKYNETKSSAFKLTPEQINYQVGLLDNGKFGLKLTF